MWLPPEQIRQLQDALLSAFPSHGNLAQMLRLQMNTNLNEVGGGSDSPLRTVTFNLIEWACAEGRVRELLEKASEFVPGNPELSALVKVFASQPEMDEPAFLGWGGSALSVKPSVQRFARLGAYAATLGALILGLTRLREVIELLLDSKNTYAVFAISAIPLTMLLLTDPLPALLRRRRDRRLREWGIMGKVVDPVYFRISPYEDSSHDRETYFRADNAHLNIFTWARASKEPVLFLSGRSGAGKSSLLNAFVLPSLRDLTPAYRTVVVRSFHDPLGALKRALLEPGLVWNRPPQFEGDAAALLRAAAAHLNPERLLIVFDQFEEFLIIQDLAPERFQALEQLLKSAMEERIEGLTLMLVLRTDYVGYLQELHLPPLRQNQNWKEIAPFTEPAAREFLARSGLNVGTVLVDDLMRQAAEIEETQGLIRPITLNMMGVVLARTMNPEGARLRRVGKRLGSLLVGYVRECVNQQELGNHGREILKHMITPSGTKRPRAVADLIRESQLHRNIVSGCLLILGERGLVRRIDEKDDVWEVSHDFVARLLVHVLGNWRNTLVQKARPWLAPAALALWALFFLLLFPQVQAWRTENAIKGTYATFDELGEIANNDIHVRHLWTSPDSYGQVVKLVSAAAGPLDDKSRAEYLLRERGFADRVFNLFETTLYQWRQAEQTGNPEAAKFLKEVVDYLTGRLLRNPRLLYYWSRSGGAMSAEYEESTIEYYDRYVLHDPDAPLMVEPDPAGPFP